jgi:Phosphate-selective porin O and P
MKNPLLLKFGVRLLFLLLYLWLAISHAQAPVKKKSLKDFTDKMKGDSTKMKVKLSGVIQVHFMDEFNTNGDNVNDPSGFRILRARLTAKGSINKYISFDVMIDPRSPEQSGMLRDAFFELHLIKNQAIRIGQQKTQFGWENRQSSTELFTVNRAEMSDGLSRGENLRDVGIGLLGHIKINDRFRIENDITFTNGTRSNVRGPFDFNTKKALWGRIGIRYKQNDFKIWVGGSFGAGGLRYLGDDIVSPTDDVYADFVRFGTDLQIDHKNFFFATEYGKGKDKVHGIVEAEPMGYQALIALKTKWKLGPVVRYDVFEDEWKVLTLGSYYGLPKDRFRMIANYVFRGNVKDVPIGHDDRFYIQMQIRF